MAERIRFTLDGRPAEAEAGTSLLAALWNAGLRAVRTSVSGEPRGPLCGMGTCFECRVTVDGEPHRRACLEPLREGMDVRAARRPRPRRGCRRAGPRPARRAREHRASPRRSSWWAGDRRGSRRRSTPPRRARATLLLDEPARPGGPIWQGRAAPAAREWLARLARSGATVLAGATVVDAPGDRRLLVERDGLPLRVRFERLVLATGARELFLPFPGWTLPGVVGAGAAQALLKAGGRFDGLRVVVAGSGPLLLAVAAALRASGARVVGVAEQAPLSRLAAFGAGLWRHPRRIAEGLGHAAALRGVPYRSGTWVREAHGEARVERVVLVGRSSGEAWDCDVLACGFGLVPNLELPRLLGCETTADGVVVDARQRTSRDGVFATGELAGSRESTTRSPRGPSPASPRPGARRRRRSRGSARTRPPSPRGSSGPSRCGPSFGLSPAPTRSCAAARTCPSAASPPRTRPARRSSHTRAGMGACQGRVCGTALGFLRGFPPDSVRSPLAPVPARGAGGRGRRRAILAAMKWQGVLPAITTPFKPDFSVDADLLVKQVDALVRAGCTGVVALGSLGEGGSLSFDEKKAVLRLCREALAGRAPLVAGVAALTTADAIRLAELGADTGCEGLMVLPPYVYKGDWRETRAHFDAVIGATPLPCMLYNNPIAYGTDVHPEQMVDLALALPNLVAVKESSADVRRVTALRALLGDRLAILVGVDDLILEGIQAGAVGWIAGLADALPAESVPALRPRRGRPDRGGAGPLRLVHAAPAARHRPEVRPAHQARPAGDRARLGDGAPAAAAPRLARARGGAGARPLRPRPAPCAGVRRSSLGRGDEAGLDSKGAHPRCAGCGAGRSAPSCSS